MGITHEMVVAGSHYRWHLAKINALFTIVYVAFHNRMTPVAAKDHGQQRKGLQEMTMEDPMRNLIFLSIAGGILLPSAVLAAQPVELRTERVSYADLNMQSVAGQKMLDRRLVHAARSVCSINVESDLVAAAAGRRCVNRSLTDARVQMSQAVASAQNSNPATAVVLASR